MRVHPKSTSAYYSLGPAYASPGVDGERWSLELVQARHGERITHTDLGTHDSQDAAKEHAEAWENAGIVQCTWYTTVEHTARIPLLELMAVAQEETDPDYYVTDDARLTAEAMTGRAVGGFSDLLGGYETDSDQRIVHCTWEHPE